MSKRTTSSAETARILATVRSESAHYTHPDARYSIAEMARQARADGQARRQK